MGILFGSLTVLSQLATIGINHLDRADTTITAIRLCQNKLGEVLAGIQPLEKVDNQPILEAPDWSYSIEVQPLETEVQPQETQETLPLSEVRVRVARQSDVAQKPNGLRGRYELISWISHGGKAVARGGFLPERN